MAHSYQPEEQSLYSGSPASPFPAVRSRRSRLLLLTGLVPVLAYAAYVWRWAFDAPLMDDVTLTDTVNRWVDEGFSGLASLLLAQLNDHRIVFSRLAALASFGLSGYLDVRAMALAGYANLLLLGWLLWRLFRTTGLKPAYFLPVPFLLYSPYLYQISLWGLVSFQPPLATAFSLASLLVLYQPRRWGWAMPLAVLALFAGGNGVMVFASGAFLLVVGRRFGHLLGWLALTGAALGAYALEYRFSSASRVSAGPLDLLGALVANTTVFAGSYLTVFSESKAALLSGVLGGVVLAVSAGLFFRKYVPVSAENRVGTGLAGLLPVPANALLFAVLLNMLGTAALIALARSGNGVREMTSDRFHLYSAVLLIAFYLVLVSSLAGRYRRWLWRAGLPLTVLANAYAYLQFRPMRDTMVESLAADAYNFGHHRVFLHQFPGFTDPDPEEFRHCRFPVTFSDEHARVLSQLARSGPSVAIARAGVTPAQHPVAFRPGLFPYLEIGLDAPTASLPGERVWLFLADEASAHPVYFLAARRQKAPLADYLRSGRFYANRFSAEVPRKVPAGRYRLGLCWFANGQVAGLCAPGVVRL